MCESCTIHKVMILSDFHIHCVYKLGVLCCAKKYQYTYLLDEILQNMKGT